MLSKFLCRILALILVFSASSWSAPDVFFKDSADFKGAYLKHEFNGAGIKFIMSKPVHGIYLPKRSCDFEALKKFTETDFKFTNGFKDDFVNMFEIDFASKFRLKEFIRELNKLLRAFSKRYPD